MADRITDNMLRPAHGAATAALLVLAACAVAPPAAPPAANGIDPAAFSTAVVGAGVPPGWTNYRLMRLKRPTRYHLVEIDGMVALEATAEASASGLQHAVTVDVREFPWISWSWKVPQLIDGADHSLEHVEDSPARVIVTFEGERDELPDHEKINYDLALAITGNRLPYATLMYVWGNRVPEGEIITHPRSTRVKMIVAASGERDLGRWLHERRNVREDYRRAFGEEPPRVKGVGIMSDSDNTGATVKAFFGDIRFSHARPR